MPGSTALDIRKVADVSERWSAPQVELLKRQAAKGATDDEFTVFLMLAKRYDLDPFMGEIWCAHFEGDKGGASVVVGRDGLLAFAERSGEFNGLVSGVVKQGDTFQMGLDAPQHSFSEERTKLIGAYAYVYRRGFEYPFRVFAEWAEHGAPKARKADGSVSKGPWAKFPSAMIRKTAEAQALRLAFRMSGVTAEGEPEQDYIDAEVIEDPGPAAAAPPLPAPAQPDSDDLAPHEHDPVSMTDEDLA